MSLRKLDKLDINTQVITFHLVLLFVTQQIEAGTTQQQLADRIGVTQEQIDFTIADLSLRLVPAAKSNGPGSKLGILIDSLEATARRIYRDLTGWSTGDCRVETGWRQMPLAGWESVCSRLLPDVWTLEWAQDLWDFQKLKQWFVQCGGSGISSAKVLLAIVNEESIWLRRPVVSIGLGWSDLVSDDFSSALPRSIRFALGLGDKRTDPGSDLTWLYLQGQACRGSEQLQQAMDILADGETPTFSVDGIAWTVWRVRRFKGQWLLDCRSDAGEIRAWSPAELAEHIKVARTDSINAARPVTAADVQILPKWLDFATADGQVDHPGCMQLGRQRDEVYLLDYSEVPWPSFHDSLVGAEILYGDGPHDPGVYRRPDDLPEDWMTRRIYPRFNRQSPADPAWVEFVSTLMPYAGKVRLRVPGHPEIEADRMLAFCVGSIEDISRNTED